MLTLILVILAVALIIAGVVCSPILLFIGVDALVITLVIKGIIKLFKKKK